MSVAVRIVLSLVLFLPALAGAREVTPDAQSLREACSGLSQVEMRECLSEKETESAEALALAEKQMKRALERWDEDYKYREEANTALVGANQSFVRYRAEQCTFQKTLSGGAAGNASELLRLSCAAALNYQRIKQLQSAASEVPDK